MNNKVVVINGVNQLIAELAGKNVKEVRGMLSQALNIAPDATFTVTEARGHGQVKKPDEDYVLECDDELEFVKPAGEKGY